MKVHAEVQASEEFRGDGDAERVTSVGRAKNVTHRVFKKREFFFKKGRKRAYALQRQFKENLNLRDPAEAFLLSLNAAHNK